MAMKISLFLVAIVALVSAQDISIMLRNRALVNRQLACILGRAQCDFIGKQIKVLIPEVIHNNCRRCTPVQEQNARKLIKFMQEQHPREWKAILEKY